MLKAIHDQGLMTHMPFLTIDEIGRQVLLFCQADESRIWKAHYRLPSGTIRRLTTGLPPEDCECSPTAWHDDAGWHVTFIAGGAKDNPLYHLYRMDGPALDQLGKPMAIHATRTGFVLGDRLVHADVENLIHVREPSSDFDIELPGAFIYRVAYCADSPDKLLISGQWQTESDVFTIEYDLETGEQHLLECDGRPAYKCTILGEQVLYAQRIGEHFEARRISTSSVLSRRAINAAVRRLPGQVQPIVTQPLTFRTGEARSVSLREARNVKGEPTGDCGCRSGLGADGVPVTRASCLECVEKHLGAAYVLLTETRDGYAHRLRAIGHLHEAEDESQQWPELHAAIREARKAYQAAGTIPDWEALAEAVEPVRKSIGPSPTPT